MTDLRQAAQQALDALESGLAFDTHSDVLQNLRTALEQQQAEPVETYIHEYRNQPHPNDFGIPKGHWWQAKQYADAVYTTPPAPQQRAEPVAYFDFQKLKFTWAKHMKIGFVPVSIKVEPMKLYSEAAQRQWVGLTDDEVKHEWEVWRANLPRYVGFAKGIEAKLKERNHD